MEQSVQVVDHLAACQFCSERFRQLTDPTQESIQELLDAQSEHRYQLKEPLGKGGQGSVYLAFDRKHATDVVIKHFDKQDPLVCFQLNSWRKEFNNSKHVLQFHQRGNRSPGIAEVFDLFEDPQQAVLVREYIDGVTLEQRVAEITDLDSADFIRQVVDWFIAIAEVVHDAHRAGILHGDLKPANIMIRADDSPVLIDFGISLDRKDLRGPIPVRAGTLNYMAPEVIRRQTAALSPRCEVWSLGVMLHELLNGDLPFDISAKTDTTNVIYILERGILFPPVHSGKLFNELQSVILRCLEPDPEDRYASAQDFASALQAWKFQQELSEQTKTPPQLPTRKMTAFICVAAMFLAIIPVVLAFKAGSVAWSIQFSWLVSGRAEFGLFWDCMRQFVLFAAMGYLIEVPFRSAFDRVFLNLQAVKSGLTFSTQPSDSKLVLTARVLWVFSTILALILLIDYHLHAAPESLGALADSDRVKDYQSLLTETERRHLAEEGIHGSRFYVHQRAYLYYMPVSVLNFLGVGSLCIAIGFYASITDTRKIFHVKQLIDRNLDHTSLPPQAVFRHFRRLCRDLSKKYLILGAVFLGWLAVEFWVESIADTAAGWAFLALTFMMSGVLVWLTYVTRYYSEVFDACRTSMEEDNLDSIDWSRENSTAAFLGDVLLGTLAGRCLLASLAICLFGFLPFYGR